MASIPAPTKLDYWYTAYNSYTYPNGWYGSTSYTVDQSTQQLYPYQQPVAVYEPAVPKQIEPPPDPESDLVGWLRGRVGEITELAWV